MCGRSGLSSIVASGGTGIAETCLSPSDFPARSSPFVAKRGGHRGDTIGRRSRIAQDHIDRDILDAAGRLARPWMYGLKVSDLELVGERKISSENHCQDGSGFENA